MKLRHLQLVNFRLHTNTEILFPASGMFGIVGPNESGKTTILEAITYALYGTKALRRGKDSVRSKRATARRQAEVWLAFEIGGVSYRVQRSESDAILFDLTNGETKVASGTAVVNDFLPGLIGMQLDEFASSFLCLQKDLTRIATMKGTERRQFFLEVMGVGKIDQALTECRKRKNDLAHERDGLAVGLGDIGPLENESRDATAAVIAARARFSHAETALSYARQSALDASDELTASEVKHQQHKAVSGDLKAAQNAILQHERAVAIDTADLAFAEAARDRVAAKAPDLDALAALIEESSQLDIADLTLKARAIAEEKVAGQDADIGGLEDAIAGASALIARFDAEAFDANADRLGDLRSHAETLRQQRRDARATADATATAAAAELKRCDRRIEAVRNAGAQGDCPTCARELADTFDHVLQVLEGLAKLQSDILAGAQSESQQLAAPTPEERAIEAQVDELAEWYKPAYALYEETRLAQHTIDRESPRLTRLKAERAAAIAKLEATPKPTFDAARQVAVRADIKRLQELDRSLSTDRGTAARTPTILMNIANTSKLLEAEKVTRDELEKELKSIAFDGEAHMALINANAAATALKEAASIERAGAVEALESANQRAKRSAAALHEYGLKHAQLAKLTEDLSTHQIAAERLAEFRTAQASMIRPELEELVSGFVSLLTDGRHEAVEINEDFEVVAFESGVAMEVVSGGGEDIIALAVRIAISQMIAERAGHPLSLLVLDEPFGSLDPVRRDGVLALIRRLGGVFEQVIVVTHVPEIRDAVDVTIEVAFDEATGSSRVTQPVAIAAAPAAELLEAVGI